MKGVLTKSFREVFVPGMAQRPENAVMKDAVTKLRMGEFALGMGQRGTQGRRLREA